MRVMNQLPLIMVPELFRQTGGVQRYSLRLIEAMDRIYGSRVPVLSLNDRLSDFPEAFLQGRRVHGCGEGGRFRRIFLLVALTLQLRPPAVFATHPGPVPWLALWKKITRTPFLCVTHGIDAWDLDPIRAHALRASDLILPVSGFTRESVAAQLGSKCPPLSILSNMVEEETFFPGAPRLSWRKRLSLPEEAPVMLTVCRLSSTERNKGYDLILESMPGLLRDNASLTWILAGKGDDLDRIRKKAERLGVEGNCRFTGFVDDEELPDLYRSSDLFVLPSRKEGFGIVFLEAAASGLPVIAGNRDGSVDALANGELGHLIDPEDGDQLVAAVRSCLATGNTHPVKLHHSCIARFGRGAFENRLRAILSEHPRTAIAMAGPPVPLA